VFTNYCVSLTDIDGFTAKEDVAAAVASPAQADPNQGK
jgi:hypothetical protein